MFLTSSAARRWRLINAVLLLLLLISYLVVRRQPERLHGGSAAGLTYGLVATLLVLVLLLFGLRKRAYRSTFGTLEGWLHAHVGLGLIVVVVATFHAGGRFADRLAVATLALLCAVVASGILGVLLYILVPRLLTDLGKQPSAEEISLNLNRLGGRMARLATGRSPAFVKVYRRLLREATPGLLAGWRLLLTGGRQRRGRASEALLKRALGQVAPDEQNDLRQLLQLARQRREALAGLARQQTYRNWLAVWLWLHLPMSLALVVLLAGHIVSALYYSGALERWGLL